MPPEDPPATTTPPADPALTAAREMGYSSVDDWKRATISSRNEGSRLASELADRNARLADIESRVLPSSYAAARRDPASTLSDLGIPTDALGDFIDQQVSQRLKPMVATNAALSRVKAVNPDFARFEPEWNAWLSTHPEVNTRLHEALNRDPDSADFLLEGAFAAFARDQRAAAPAQNGAPAALPGGAALPATQSSVAGRANELATGPTPEEISRLLAQARRGNPRAMIELVKLRVGTQPHPELPPTS